MKYLNDNRKQLQKIPVRVLIPICLIVFASCIIKWKGASGECNFVRLLSHDKDKLYMLEFLKNASFVTENAHQIEFHWSHVALVNKRNGNKWMSVEFIPLLSIRENKKLVVVPFNPVLECSYHHYNWELSETRSEVYCKRHTPSFIPSIS